MDFASSLQSHHTKLGEHERRLNDHDDVFKTQGEAITNVRLDLAKLIAMASIVTAILTISANAVIVRYLTPLGDSPARSQAAPRPH